MTLGVGDVVPDFQIAVSHDTVLSSKDLSGKKWVIYFYPKDNTPGCTTEAKEFRDLKDQFAEKGVGILGISRDSLKKHDGFSAKYELNFPLGADENGEVCDKFGCWVQKSMFGKKYMGIERSTFLIDENGVVQKIWRKVKVKGHVEAVFASV